MSRQTAATAMTGLTGWLYLPRDRKQKVTWHIAALAEFIFGAMRRGFFKAFRRTARDEPR